MIYGTEWKDNNILLNEAKKHVRARGRKRRFPIGVDYTTRLPSIEQTNITCLFTAYLPLLCYLHLIIYLA